MKFTTRVQISYCNEIAGLAGRVRLDIRIRRFCGDGRERALYECRHFMKKHMIKDNIHPGQHVSIVLKQDYGTDRRVEGYVDEVLTTTSYHTRGIKVRLRKRDGEEEGLVGRVQEILPYRTA